jgi:hypothetical protein
MSSCCLVIRSTSNYYRFFIFKNMFKERFTRSHKFMTLSHCIYFILLCFLPFFLLAFLHVPMSKSYVHSLRISIAYIHCVHILFVYGRIVFRSVITNTLLLPVRILIAVNIILQCDLLYYTIYY